MRRWLTTRIPLAVPAVCVAAGLLMSLCLHPAITELHSMWGISRTPVLGVPRFAWLQLCVVLAVASLAASARPKLSPVVDRVVVAVVVAAVFINSLPIYLLWRLLNYCPCN